MSAMTLPPAAGGFDGWDDLAAFAALVEDFDRDTLFDGQPRREHRPARCNAERAAIQDSLREAS